MMTAAASNTTQQQNEERPPSSERSRRYCHDDYEENNMQQQQQQQQQQNHRRQYKLSSLVLPWMMIVLISVVAAILVFWDDAGDDSSSSSSSATTTATEMERLLLLEDTADDEHYHHHAHKNIYEEVHPTLFPLSNSDKLGFVFAIMGLMIAAGGGIGGGGILVPIYILVMGFSPKHAIPLSNITVFGGACANMWLNLQKRHPLADRPLVDWDLILVMEPLTIAGALIGAFLNKVLPETFLVIMLVVLLSFTAYTTLKKAMKMYKAETKRLRDEEGIYPDGTKESELTRIDKQSKVGNVKEAGDELLDNMDLQDGEVPGGNNEEETMQIHNELNQILEEERVVPMKNVYILVGLFIVVLVINLLKGGGAFPSPIGIQCGSSMFWLANCFMLLWIISIACYARSYLVQRYEIKKDVGYMYVDGDIKWDGRATIVYPCICCLAGFFAGMFGVGGGIVKGPLMLAMEVHPAVASASSACMILFTSFTATTSFMVFGLLDGQYAPVCFTVGVLATYVGQVGLGILMKRAKRNSYIAFSIGGVVLLSALLMTVQSVLSMAEGERHKSGGICGKDTR